MTTLLHKAYRFVRYGDRRARLQRHFNTMELKRQVSKMRTYPSVLYLDPATACNLRCPFCATGNGVSELRKENLKPETFYKIVENLPMDALQNVNLYHWGEPLLNPHLSEYIRYFAERGKFVTINANFSHKDYDEEYLTELVQSGLGECTVSIDGATQEAYEMYRVRGNLERVLNNLRKINGIKKRLGTDLPHVTYKMLLNKFNEHQIKDAERLAEEVGADFYAPDFLMIPDEERDAWESEAAKEKYEGLPTTGYAERRGELIHTECRQLWDTLLVNSDGGVFPCCMVYDHDAMVGNLADQHISEIWNGEKMQYLRRYAVEPELAPPDFHNNCEHCTHRYCKHDVQ
jgi:radical SAM protein with 4Fe4S-binding SPASM domain